MLYSILYNVFTQSLYLYWKLLKRLRYHNMNFLSFAVTHLKQSLAQKILSITCSFNTALPLITCKWGRVYPPQCNECHSHTLFIYSQVTWSWLVRSRNLLTSLPHFNNLLTVTISTIHTIGMAYVLFSIMSL